MRLDDLIDEGDRNLNESVFLIGILGGAYTWTTQYRWWRGGQSDHHQHLSIVLRFCFGDETAELKSMSGRTILVTTGFVARLKREFVPIFIVWQGHPCIQLLIEIFQTRHDSGSSSSKYSTYRHRGSRRPERCNAGHSHARDYFQ